MFGIEKITQDTIQEVSKTILDGSANGSLTVRKTLETSNASMTGINLEGPSKQLVPLMSPFRQSIGRTTRPGAVASQWRAITGLSQPKPTVAETNPGPVFTTTAVSKTATYKLVALRGQVTREMVAASEGFDPALAKETANTLLLAMKLEEMQMLGGNVSALATPSGGVATSVAVTGGAFTNVAWYFRVAALTLPAANRIQIDKPADYASSDALLAPRAVTGIDAAGDGVTTTSASFTVTPTANHGVRLSWTPVPGAAAYAVFAGTTNDATVKCQCVVTQAFVTLLSGAAAGDAASVIAAGTSADALAYDGIMAQMWAVGSGAYQKNLAGVLTQANGELVQIQDAFQSIWDNAKIGQFRILVAGQEARKMTSLGVVAGGGPTLNFGPEGSRGRLTQGYSIGAILNSVTGDVCPVETLPWLTAGQILILPTSVPYPDSNTSAPFDMAMGYDWERWDYASTAANGNARVYPFEVVCYGALRALFTGGCGVIHNIYKG